jgi:quinohemoprotein ethanol dehydrogenase
MERPLHSNCRSNGVLCRFTISIGVAQILAFAIPTIVSSHSREYVSRASSHWQMVGGDWSNSRHSVLSQINPQSIQRLGPTWISPKFAEAATTRSPIVERDGLLFVTAGRHVYAFDARTGEPKWSHNTVPAAQPKDFAPTLENELASLNSPMAVPNGKGVGVGEGLVYVGLKDGHVIALDQFSGELRWARQTGVSHSKKGQWAAVAPTYANGVVFSGLSDGDHNLRGQMVALEAKTGILRWNLFSVPGPGERGHETWPSFNESWKVGGGGVWTNPSVDPDLGLVYFTAGNAVPAYGGDWRPGINLYTCSVLAVDIKTGKLRWHFQLIHHDVFEADLGVPVVLYDAVKAGRVRKALAVMRADGHLFNLDRATGEPILPIEQRSVPQSVTQNTSPTQPFPVVGESILMTCEEWKKEPIPKGFTLGCMFTPPSSPPPSLDPQNVLVPFPSVKGHLMAFSPSTGYFYIQASSWLHWPRRSQDPYFLNWVGAVPGLRSYAELAAIDSRTGKIAWRKRTLNGTPGSGPLVTAGNVLFHSAGDGHLNAYDAKSGDLLWQFQLGTAAGPAATYQIDGEQYVAVAAGSSVWALKLGGSISPPSSATLSTNTEEFPGPLVDAEEIETTTLHRSLIEPGARYFIDEFTFNPSRARIAPGAPVLFVNNGSMRHEIVAVDGTWGTGALGPTQEAWLTFKKPGSYTYICKDHPWSYGQIVISEGSTSASQSPSVSDNPNAVSQRAHGRQQFNRHCSACHGEDLSGRASAPPLSGAAFITRWGSASVRDLFDNVRTTMPQTSPGSLDRRAYLDIIAYLLDANQSPLPEAGLPDAPEALATMPITK